MHSVKLCIFLRFHGYSKCTCVFSIHSFHSFTLSLRVFGEYSTFHSTYSPKTHNSASSLNTLYTAENVQFYSAFSPSTISLRRVFCDIAQPCFALSPKTGSYRKLRISVRIIKMYSKMLAVLCFVFCIY
jgi:hypothetical protein